MDNCISVKSALRNGSSSGDLEKPYTKNHHTHGIDKFDPIVELGNILHNKLQVKDEDSGTPSDSPSDSPSDEDGSSGLDNENTNNHDLNMDIPTSMASKPLDTFHGKKLESDPEDYSNHSRSLSMSTPRKLISAMKGSREKEGISPMKLRVSWAPDVYDPPPSSVSHYPKKKSHQQHSKSYKKHGKGKQKGKNVRGGSGSKEKKHYRKSGGSSNRSMQSYLDMDRLDKYNSSMDLLDFNDPGTGSPDPNCGSKFLGQSSGATHCVY